MNSKSISLLPCIVFLITFISLSIIYSSHAAHNANFSIFATFMALIIATFTFHKNETFNERMEIFIQGSSQLIVVHMCYTLFLSTIFTTVLDHTGSLASAVNVSLHIFPTWFILPGIFLGSAFFTFAIGSSFGAVAAFMPVASSIAEHVQLQPSLMAATIVCGSVCGDNLSILSETSILSVKAAGTTMIKKFFLNIKIVLPAFIGTVLILFYKNNTIQGCSHLHNITDLNYLDFIKALPYSIAFILALTGLDIVFVMSLGIIIAMLIGLYFQNFTPLDAINFMFDGFYNTKEMVHLFVLIALLSGLANIITHNGGIQYIIDKFKYKISNTRHAKLAIFCWIAIINIILIFNSIAIIVAGPTAKKIAHECDIDPAQAACILNIVSSVLQGILPYTPLLILTASIAHVPILSLFPYFYYQFLLIISLLIIIIWNPKKCNLQSTCLE